MDLSILKYIGSFVLYVSGLILSLIYLLSIFMIFASKFKFFPKFYNKFRYSNVIWWLLLICIITGPIIYVSVRDLKRLVKNIGFWILIVYCLYLFLLSFLMLFGPKIKALQGLYNRVNNMKIFGFDGVLSFTVIYGLLTMCIVWFLK